MLILAITTQITSPYPTHRLKQKQNTNISNCDEENWSVVKLLGYVILGIGAITLVNANIKTTQANQPEPVAETTTPYNRSRHTITLTLNQLDELKVTESQRVNPGDIISDRTSSRAKLQAKKERLEAAIKKASLPLNQLKPVPIPKFQTELAALKQAQFNLDVIVKKIENFDQQLHLNKDFQLFPLNL